MQRKAHKYVKGKIEIIFMLFLLVIITAIIGFICRLLNLVDFQLALFFVVDVILQMFKFLN